MAKLQAAYKLNGRLVTIRNAEPDDASALIALVNRFDAETTFLTREPGEFDMTEERERDILQAKKDAPHCLYLVAEVEGNPVATAHAEYGQKRRYRNVAHIGIAVAKAYWGIGIGRALLEELIRWLEDNGVEKVNLTVDTNNIRAQRLYQSLGFFVEGRQARESKMADGSYREAYWMGLLLPRAVK